MIKLIKTIIAMQLMHHKPINQRSSVTQKVSTAKAPHTPIKPALYTYKLDTDDADDTE
ncbi:MAG: hypothetical protein NTW52_15120 [Planctomycetota bacterium]|nr:hypothetical protein [Planctomycetota bacterium]